MISRPRKQRSIPFTVIAIALDQFAIVSLTRSSNTFRCETLGENLVIEFELILRISLKIGDKKTLTTALNTHFGKAADKLDLLDNSLEAVIADQAFINGIDRLGR